MGIQSTSFDTRSWRLGVAGALALGLLGAAPDPARGSSPNQGIDRQATYEALVRRTEGGVPHIKAADFASLGFGTGYAMAQDNICILADQFLTFSAERSHFHGPQGVNLQSDFFYRLFIDRAEALEPVDPRQAAVFRGAAAGYNRYLRDVGVANLPDPTCRGQFWVREISEVDFRRISRMNFFYPFLLNQLVAAVPPAPPAASAEPAASQPLADDEARRIERTFHELIKPLESLGSNGIAIGRQGTVKGTGMLLANPHQPWTGTGRFYAFHQTLPGELDVIGANVMGRPQVGLGATEHIAWTSTVQTGPLNTFYRLTLVPGNPTQYLFDGEPRDMIAETVTVRVPDSNGGFTSHSHTFYSTHFGARLVGGPFFPWTNTTAFAVRAADAGWRGIDALMPQYQARNVHDYKAVQDKYQFNPSNQIAADSSGNAYYANTATIPNLDDAQRAACTVPGGLDGSRSECMWKTDPDAAIPGIFGPSKLPSHIRTDFASNMNDSYWLSNPADPLTGFDSSLGPVGTPRSFRTRSGLVQILERLDGTDGKGPPKFTLEHLQELITDNVAYTGRVLRDDLVTLCENNPSVTLTSGTVVDISAACPVLAAWDLRDNLDSHGAHLFREFAAINANARNYAVPFDVNDPVNTPRGLDTTNNPAVLQALATAVQRLRSAGIPLDARLGDLQYVVRNDQRIPIPGGTNASGLLNIIGAPFSATDGGYPNVTNGSSWIQATEFTKNKGPVSRGIMTYSQTTNPDSPHFDDMTRLFSQGEWVDLPFREADVAAAATESLNLSEGKDDCKHGGWRAFTKPAFANQGTCVAYFEIRRLQRLWEIRKRRQQR